MFSNGSTTQDAANLVMEIKALTVTANLLLFSLLFPTKLEHRGVTSPQLSMTLRGSDTQHADELTGMTELRVAPLIRC